MNKIFQILTFVLASLLIIPNIVLAQTDVLTGVVEALLGRIPGSCIGGFDKPECIQCLTVVNIVPFAFFLSLFFLVFYFVIQMMMPGTPIKGPRGEEGIQPAEMKGVPLKVAAVIGFVLTILVVHTDLGKISNFGFWITLVFFALTLLILKSLLKLTGAYLIVTIIVVIFVLIGMWAFITGAITPFLEQWQELCVG